MSFGSEWGRNQSVAFVLAHPELYRLIIESRTCDRRRRPGLAAAAGALSARLAELIGMLTAEGCEPLLDLAERSTRALIAGFADG